MPDLDNTQKDSYFVAVKVFLEKDNSFFIFKDKFGNWDLPGGRIKKDEFNTSLEDIVARKLREEIGDSVKYRLESQPKILMRHERTESSPTSTTARILAIGFRAKLLSGDPKLSDAHTEMLWVDTKTFRPENYFTGGWLEGVKDYLAIQKLT